MKSEVKVLVNICKGCLYCINFCPKHVLALSEDFNAKGNHYAIPQNPEECVGCGMCTEICPDAAIELKEVE